MSCSPTPIPASPSSSLRGFDSMCVVDGEERCIDLLNDVLVNAHADDDRQVGATCARLSSCHLRTPLSYKTRARLAAFARLSPPVLLHSWRMRST